MRGGRSGQGSDHVGPVSRSGFDFKCNGTHDRVSRMSTWDLICV